MWKMNTMIYFLHSRPREQYSVSFGVAFWTFRTYFWKFVHLTYENMDTTTNTETEAVVTKEFLEKALKTPVEKFVVSAGSILGDGYTCVLYSVDVWKKGQAGEDEPLHILIKAFPSNPARQHFLDLGLFPVELAMYEEVIPELIRFQESVQVENKVRLPFAPYLGGQYIPKEGRNG